MAKGRSSRRQAPSWLVLLYRRTKRKRGRKFADQMRTEICQRGGRNSIGKLQEFNRVRFFNLATSTIRYSDDK